MTFWNRLSIRPPWIAGVRLATAGACVRGPGPTKSEIRRAVHKGSANLIYDGVRTMSKSRSRRKRAIYRQKPGDELSIQQLEAVARYLGYSLVCLPGSADLVDCRTSHIVARGDIALNHLRSLYVERDLADIPELEALEGGQ